MSFCMFRQYSTASKIIDMVEEKFSKKIKQNPEICHWLVKQMKVDDQCFVDEQRLNFNLSGKKALARVLGDILKENLSDDLYEIYQQLPQKEKHNIRQQIANAYDKLIDLCIEANKSKEGILITEDFFSFNVDLQRLPEIFTNKKVLYGELKIVLEEVKNNLQELKLPRQELNEMVSHRY